MTQPTLLFTREEYEGRLAAVRREMRGCDADLVLLDEAEHLSYVTGFDRPLNVQEVRLARGLRAPPRSWTLLVALAREKRFRPWTISCQAWLDTCSAPI
jgi:Xaa-Pro aminopeptidase